ncbi:hypothetical protein ACIGEZ_20945 [Streptomyces sp. NPDC085481]|uniref:hypothetical protein n=1 Tax=Streptomyces sp. NPDC085481 TaxID=3365727 RepID=UPI0037D3C3D9
MAATGARRQFVWTVLPAGRVGTVTGGSEPMALLSLLLTPRLLGPSSGRLTVADFGMQSWPQRLDAVRLDVRRAQQPQPLTSLRVPYVTAEGKKVDFTVAQRLNAWRALFPADTLVRGYTANTYDGRESREFPATEAAAEIRQAYTATALAHLRHAEASEDAPDGSALRAELRRITEGWQTGLWPLDGDDGGGGGAVGAAYGGTDGAAYGAGGTGAAASGADGAAASGSALARAYAYYRRDSADFTPLAEPPAAAVEREFHETVARLADHPLLLRALGLLVDLAVPASQLTQGDAKDLRVVPVWPNPDTGATSGWGNAVQEDLSPRTAYVLEGTRFVAASVQRPAATLFTKGLLPLTGVGVGPSGSARYEVMPFDVDGAALRMVGAAQSDRTRPQSDADTGALPALRSTGFALVERDRAAEHARQLQRARERATPAGLTSVPLTADSLLGGYRVDIFDEQTKQWYSLCRRRVRYTIGGVPIGQEATAAGPRGHLEEGYVRPDPVTTGAGADDALFIHQAVVRWTGWNQVAQRPERVVDTGDETFLPDTDAMPFDAVVECDPGSLPRLRFGRDYRLRVRIADLAGGGLRSEEAGPAEEQTEVFTHHRYEPLLPPELVPTRKLADGETLDRMVIRSDRDTTVTAYAAAHGHRAYDLRHLLAPNCALELAIQHEGRFDAALGPEAPTADVKRLFETARRADRDIHDIPGAVVAEGGPGSGTQAAPYVVLPEADVVVPWLPDPGSTHISLIARHRPVDPDTGDAGTIEGLPKIAVWRGDWPETRSVAFRLEAAPSGCKVTRSTDHRLVTVALGPAEQVTFDIPSCPKTRDVQIFGIAAWLGIDPSNPPPSIAQGRNRLITPPRTVTLVHAVQRPLSDPGGVFNATRTSGDTSAVLRTEELELDVPSTGRIDVRARWTDHEDLPPAAPVVRERQAFVGSYDVQHLPLYQALPTIRQEFGDTRRRHVTYRVTGVSRFQDCFPRATAADPAACLAEGVLRTTDVPSSARPPAPKLLYTVPTFHWTQTTDGQRSITRWRHGGGLRVFMERPWYVSGDGEALAVLTWPSPSAPADTLAYVSVAGRDPIWNTGAPPAILTDDHVNAPGAALREDLPELQRALGALAFPVHFDEEGDRWYADIDLSPLVTGSYFPFVRLALARYQPHTIDGVPRLSPSIRTEPVQLPPHRRLTVSRTPGHGTVLVDGLGPSGPRSTTVESELQVRDTAGAAGAGDIADAGWTTVFHTTALLGQVRDFDIPDTGARPLRVVVQEFEKHPSATNDVGTATEQPGRLVYADIVPLGTWPRG